MSPDVYCSSTGHGGYDRIKWLAQTYRHTLLEDVVPFWMAHRPDADGAISNCLDGDGKVVSRDRYLWSQGRALWTFSALYNRIQPRDEWLQIADRLFRYLQSKGRDARGHWMYRLDIDGNVLDGDISIYVDGFVMNGAAEYYLATGNEQAANLALETFENVCRRIGEPGSYGIAPYALPKGTKTLGIPMIFSFVFYNLGKALGRPDIMERGRRLAHEILTDFFIADRNAVHELVKLEGGSVDSPEGRVCIPGHVLEAMWFLISIFEDTGDKDRIATCLELVRRHLEIGWDEEYGGIVLAVNTLGQHPVCWRNPECKAWWAQLEALVATAYAYQHTQSDWCIEWHDRIRQYAYSHFPLQGGEWAQWLDRFGRPIESNALPVKDPFHLPRALIYLFDLCNRQIHN